MVEHRSNLFTPKNSTTPFPAVVLVIDAQNDFLAPSAPYPCVNADLVVANIAQAVKTARDANIPVIFTREAHSISGADYGMEFVEGAPSHCVEGTPGFEIVPELKPLAGEFVIDKRRYNAFLGTHLDLVLNLFGRPTLFITGLTTNVCVHYTAAEAFQRDYQVHVIRECVSATSDEKHKMGLRMLDFISTRIVINLENFYSSIRAHIGIFEKDE